MTLGHRPPGVATDARIMAALFASCWLALPHFAPNIAVESIA
jgi:hypothetical protein